MKLLEEAFTKGGGGHVRLVPDNPEDMWHVYNLIRVDDHVDAVTFRKVTRGGGDEHAGAAESERVRVRLRLRVEDVAYDGEPTFLEIGDDIVAFVLGDVRDAVERMFAGSKPIRFDVSR